MFSIFKSPYKNASSAAVEGDFALLKTNILKHKTTPMTVDRFLVTHLNSIESSMKMVRSSQIQEYSFIETISDQYNYKDVGEPVQQVTPMTSPTRSISSTVTVDEEETWDGYKTFTTGPLKNSQNDSINTGKNTKRPKKYVNSCPEIDRILNRSRMRSHLTSIILNGNIPPLCIYNKKTFVVNNTCPIDSVIVAIAIAYVDCETYALFIDKTRIEFLNLGKTLDFTVHPN